MSKIIGRLRARQARQLPSPPHEVTQAPTHTRTDLVLQRLANASQLALVLLAIFGYFYTVLPVYQKSLLDEDIAKRTLELRVMESRIAQAETLLASREAEFSVMTKRVTELKAVADVARQRLGRAQAEVGTLRGAVETQYMQLLPRLLRDFQTLALSQCKSRDGVETAFGDCVERKVLTSPSLSGLESADKTRLLSIARRRSSMIDSSLSEFSLGIARKKQDADTQAKEAQARCDGLKNGEDYKDKIKKISIDYQCSTEVNRLTSERLKIQIDEMFSGDKVLSPHLSEIVKEFFANR
jgi:hypothetical protein